MPTLWAHGFYFNNSSTSAAPIAAPTRGGYPAWQSGVVMGFGIGVVVSVCVEWIRCLIALVGMYQRLDPEQRAVMHKVGSVLTHEAYPLARQAVRKTATTLHFNRPEAWLEHSRTLKRDASQAENTFRHMEACRLMRANLLNSTVNNPDGNLIVELAYHGFTLNRRG